MSGNEFARFAADLLRASTGIDALGAKAAEKIGRGALKTAQSIAPTETGDLERSLTFRRDGSTAVVQSSLHYAAFQEYGTSVMAPNPFMGPAVDEWGPRLVAEVEGIRDKVIKDLG
jgi:HK97 gp10 family phage protein